MRQYVIIRHALAEDREDFAKKDLPDDARPLTRQGRIKMKQAAIGLTRILKGVDLVVTSPLLRAVQTAEIIAKACNDRPVVETPLLSPGNAPDHLLQLLLQYPEDQRIALVGHEPDLSCWISWALTGSDIPFLHLKKGGVCLIEFPQQVVPGKAELRWLLTPKQLRRIEA